MSTPVAELSVTDLGLPGRVLGAGGQVIVHDLPGFRLPGEPQRLVYKAYNLGMDLPGTRWKANRATPQARPEPA